MVFISNAERSRHSYIEDRIESARMSIEAALEDEHVARELGDTAGRVLAILDDTYIPNLRHGRLQTPKHYRTDTSIAVFALHDGETVEANEYMTTLHASQKLALPEFAEQSGAPADVVLTNAQEALHEVELQGAPTINLGVPSKEKILTSTARMRIDGQSYAILGRPTIALRTREFQNDRLADRSLVHILGHADKFLVKPPVRFNQVRRDQYNDEKSVRALEQDIARASFLNSRVREDH
jgi:hypothetical protein